MTRRTFLIAAAAPQTEIAIDSVRSWYEDFLYRAPYQFGGKTVDRVTLLNVEVTVKTRDGRRQTGFGSMSMGNIWAYPGKPYDQTLGEMKTLAGRIEKILAGYPEYGHPIDIGVALELEYLKAAPQMPKLAALVTASPFDAAVHDAYGKLLGRSIWQCYGPDCLRRDLGAYLGPDFRGERLDRYVLRKPRPKLAMFHSVGAADAIEPGDVKARLNDGLPETLGEWIRYNGLTHLKIKLNGGNLAADVERVVRIDRVAGDKIYCLDFNENCPNVSYFLDFLKQVKARAPRLFDKVQYVEQPTRRDLKADRANVMHKAAKLRPVVIDESLVDLESLLLAREMGYTGVALKACKGQTHAVLMAAAAQKYKMFLCVQDLTCPGASLIHSVSLAAHVPGVAGIEANARQYVPAANQPWVERFPGVFRVEDGSMRTGALTGPGLGVTPA
jgi:L-alanine-DL-glutamate epimerase-like enolase superfamily enzyme